LLSPPKEKLSRSSFLIRFFWQSLSERKNN
ncbi:MAG: hypothetical protein ACI8QH_000383, partial [Flammeovirgaceae bacterium]